MGQSGGRDEWLERLREAMADEFMDQNVHLPRSDAEDLADSVLLTTGPLPTREDDD